MGWTRRGSDSFRCRCTTRPVVVILATPRWAEDSLRFVRQARVLSLPRPGLGPKTFLPSLNATSPEARTLEAVLRPAPLLSLTQPPPRSTTFRVSSNAAHPKARTFEAVVRRGPSLLSSGDLPGPKTFLRFVRLRRNHAIPA